MLPFDRFEGSDAVLGPEMRSTGEVMGIARDFPTAFAKAQAAAGVPLPSEGTAFITVTDSDKSGAFAIAQILHDVGFRIVATRGTAEAIARMGVPVQRLNKIGEGSPHVRRLDRARRRGPGRQHAHGLGRAHRRLGDPPRRGRARHPLPDHARRGRQRGAGDRAGAGRAASPRCCACRSCTAGLAPKRARRTGPGPGSCRCSASRQSSSRSPHRRLLRVSANEPLGGAYRVLRVSDPDGPPPDPGQFAMLAAAERWGGGRDERPYLARAFSIARAREDGEAHYLLEDVGPGTRRLCELQAGEGLLVLGPLGRGFATPRTRIAARCSSAAAWGSRRWRSCRTR